MPDRGDMASAPGGPARRSVPPATVPQAFAALLPAFFDTEHAVHATGRFAALIRTRRPEPTRSQSAPTSAAHSATARPVRLDTSRPPQPPRAPQRPHTPVQQALSSAARQGLIPASLAVALHVVTDETANPAIRSESAQRAAFEMAALQERAFLAEPFLAQTAAMATAHQRSRQAVRDASDKVGELLGAIYQNPAQAAADLKLLIEGRPGPGHAARDIAEEPEILGALKGGLLFGRREREQARQLVPQLTAAVEARGRRQAEFTRDKQGLNDLKAQPARNPVLSDALQAQNVLDTVRAAVPGPDPLSADMLMLASHEAALLVTPAHLDEATDLSGPYMVHLAEQASRMAAVRALLDDKAPSKAVDRFIQAAQVMETNLAARDRLQRQGAIYPAEQAAIWASAASDRMLTAARTIMSDYDQHQDATQRQVLPLVIDYLREADRHASHHQADEMASDGPAMG